MSDTMKKTSNHEMREIIAEEFSYLIGKIVGVRPCGDNADPATYYRELPAEMKVHVNTCVDRIAVRLTGQSPITGEKLT